ncbi:UDP-galactopyranose mutase [Frigoriflavimonas asaccharolytica]|uniref:UDP-galactopyranose mutase n=1 Tax=Frigoriflavimonas asaccharolytica TaxID=2735899 RepID=A0A8J8G7U6_9FLAO|nr:UDP-galactopyranose mutase [Frigoriflavimonas asaccharolytica]NRS92919.1 UDP-galactopyranose mutase [Frigoriflavimonas asaccharolytica]
MKNYDILIIGAGISGSVLAERYARKGKSVLIMDKRDHIAGNCFDYKDQNGILTSKYGAHLFHTNDEGVWKYVNRFSDWYKWEHKVIARVDDKTVPIPVNITTVNTLFNINLTTEVEMQKWLADNRIEYSQPKNGEEAVLNRVGEVLYDKMFKHYTKKQWDKYPAELHASVLERIPVRDNYDDRYFSDIHQALPKGGYTQMFENILDHPNIQILLNTDYFEVMDQLSGYEKLFYTGPVDRFFEFNDKLTEKLEYRSINFVTEHLEKEYFQENSVVNYPGKDVEFTRIVEYKHFGNQQSDKTTIVKEFTVDEGEPYYPVPNEKNQEIYSKYKEEADKLTDVYFVGRLANYKYFNMDQAFRNALDLFEELECSEPKILENAQSF